MHVLAKLLAVTCVIAGWSLLVSPQVAFAQTSPPTINITGEGTATVVPDTAQAVTGVVTEGKTAREAAEANATRMNALVAAAKQAGIAERDLRTARFSIDPIHVNRRDEAPQLVGYRASNSLYITIRNIGKVGEILDHLIAAGATDLDSIDFSASDPSKALDAARSAAFADAKRKADLYAQAAGAKVGRALSIAEQEAYGAPRGRRYSAGARAAAAAPTPIEAGEDTLRIQVAVTFELLQ